MDTTASPTAQTAPRPPQTFDLAGALLNIEQGVYAIRSMVARDWAHSVEADKARLGIECVTTTLERDVRAILNPLVDAPPTGPLAAAAHPDAELLAALAEFDRLEALAASMKRDATSLEDERERDRAAEPIEAQRNAALDRVCTVSAKTPDGWRARARSFLKWDMEIAKTLAEDQPGDCLDERMIAALLRDLTAQDGDRDMLAGPSAMDLADAALIEACAAHPVNIIAYNASQEGGTEPPNGPLWEAYERTCDMISDAEPQTMAGVLAKAEAAKAEAMSNGEEHWEGSMGAGWACDIVNDLLRLAGRA